MPQISYSRVEKQSHPEADGSKIALGSVTRIISPDQKDYEIAGEIVDLYKKLPKSDASGEWAWINENRKKSYFSVLERGSAKDLAGVLANMFRNNASYGLVSSEYIQTQTLAAAKELENQILLDLDVWREFTEQEDLKILEMPRAGNPYGAEIGGTLISVDSARHDYFALKILSLQKFSKAPAFTILDIGGGYGGLALALTRRMPQFRYIDLDLPESLFLAYYFLRKSTDKKIAWLLAGDSRDVAADILLVPAPFHDLINEQADLAFNCQSLSEMSKETVARYMSLFSRLGPRFFLHQNSNFLLFPDSTRHREILSHDFPLDKSRYREVYRAVSPWQGGGGRYREFFYERL